MDRLTAMEMFVRVVETGSFTAAARQLNIGQPAVSKAIAQLEMRLGARLLMRSTRRLMPTEAGQKFYERVRRAVEEAREAELVAQGTNRGLMGRLRVSASVTFGRIHLVPIIPNFLAAHPGLSIDLELDDRTVDLIEERIDVGFRLGPLISSSLTARKLITKQRLVLATSSYFERAGIPATPSDLTTHPAVIYTRDAGGSDTWSFQQGPSEIQVSLSGRLRVSAAEGLRAAILGGMGIAITPHWLFSPELASGAVRAVLTDWSLPPSDVWAVSPAGRMASVKARSFVSFVENELQKITSSPKLIALPIALGEPFVGGKLKLSQDRIAVG
jgi:DNA-binding transcriptional LysR family regulator